MSYTQSDEGKPSRLFVEVNGHEVGTRAGLTGQEATLSGGSEVKIKPLMQALHVVGRFQPDEETEAELEGGVGSGEVADVGIQINGACWGWAWNDSESIWHLLPCDFDTSATAVFSFNASFEESMTGGVVAADCSTLDGVTVATQWDDVDGIQGLEVQYGGDWQSLASSAASLAFDWEMNRCPICIEEAGWLLHLRFDDAFGHQWVCDAMGEGWRPCSIHSPAAAQGIDLIGCSARWANDHWMMS